MGFKAILNAARKTNVAGIWQDIKKAKEMGTDGVADKMSPENIASWINTRVFGSYNPAQSTMGRMHNERMGISAWSTEGYKANLRDGLWNNKGKLAAGYVGYQSLGWLDDKAGLLKGGPDYGSLTGFGEEGFTEKNALTGARTNTNYQAQMAGLQELSSNQVAPQYSMTLAPMRQRKASSALRDSTQGLTLGLHNGRRGGG